MDKWEASRCADVHTTKILTKVCVYSAGDTGSCVKLHIQKIDSFTDFIKGFLSNLKS